MDKIELFVSGADPTGLLFRQGGNDATLTTALSHCPAMRREDQTYDEMLARQAQMSFPLECPLYTHVAWLRARNVLDFGAGNGAYTELLARRWPNKAITCLERDEQLAQHASARCTSANVEFVVGQLDTLGRTRNPFDFLIARLVLSHNPNRTDLIRDLASLLAPTAGVLVVDADDAALHFEPDLKYFRKLLVALRRKVDLKGGARDSQHLVATEWRPYGFDVSMSIQLIPNSLQVSKEAMFLYMYLTAEYAANQKVPSDVQEELLEWLLNPASYAQYGLFATLLTRTA